MRLLDARSIVKNSLIEKLFNRSREVKALLGTMESVGPGSCQPDWQWKLHCTHS
jgi:hypothetical protein